MQRSKKAVSLIYLACAFLSWMIFREAVASIWAIARLPLPHDWIVSPIEIVAAVLGIVVFVLLLKNARINTFTNEVITELGKVTWPQRKETVLSTGVVSVLVGICAIILFLFDMVWGAVVKVFYQ